MPASTPMFAEQRRLRVAMVTETYLPEINGVAITMGRLVDGLREREHTIQLIRPRQFPNEVPARAPFFEEVLHRGLAIPGYDVLKLGFPAKGKLLRLWKIKRPDVVHIVTEGPLGWSALSAARALGIQRFSHQFSRVQQTLWCGVAEAGDRRLSAFVTQSRALHDGADRWHE